MKVQDGEKNIEVWFVRLVAICSMLSVWKVRIGGMDLLPVLLFVLVLFWMAFLIVLINQGKRKWRQRYGRLDMAMGLLLLYELGQLVVTILVAGEEEVPDYSLNLLLISLVMLYLMMMETDGRMQGYLDLILYGGLVVMTVLLLGYLCSPRIGESLFCGAIRQQQDPICC